MVLSQYVADTRTGMHRGALYPFRPVVWVPWPLFIVRNHRFGHPGHADIYRHEDRRNPLRDAFRQAQEKHEEDIVARGKLRYVVVISNDYDATRTQIREAIIAPIYSMPVAKHQGLIDRIRTNQMPNTFYLPADPTFGDIAEGYIDLRQVQPTDKRYLPDEDRLSFALSPSTLNAILGRYVQYLGLRTATP